MEAIHHYEVNLELNQGGKGRLSSPLLPEAFTVATPPDFENGIGGIWSPEHLFVAAVNSCLMTTFLAVAKNSKLDYLSFRSNAVGTIEKTGDTFRFTEIILKPTVTITDSSQVDRARRVLEMSERNCIISNAITARIMLLPEILVE